MNAPDQLQNVGDIDRKTYLGGSDAAAVLGLDPYGKTPLTVYLAKIGELGGTPDPEKEKFLRRRKRFEEPIVAMLREEFGGEIVAMNARYIDPEHGFLAAEIDFEWADADGVIQNGEIKTVSPFAFNERGGWGEVGTDEIPIHYHCQVMHGLGVTGRQVCILAALAGLDTMVFYRVERDEDAIADMRAAQVRFWREHVEARVPPEPINLSDAQRLFSRRNGVSIEVGDELADKVRTLRDVRAEAKLREATADELAADVAIEICKAWGVPEGEEPKEDNAVLLYRGQKIATWARGRSTFLDQRALAAKHPEIKKAYTRETHFRTFRFPKS